jgi:transposase
MKARHPIDETWGRNWQAELERLRQRWRGGLTVCPYCPHPLPQSPEIASSFGPTRGQSKGPQP